MKKFLLTSTFILLSLISFAQIAENAEDVTPIKVGEQISNIEVTSLEGQQNSILKVVKEKPTVLLFYRGGWCPYCNKHLAAVGQSNEEIQKLGYQIVGVSPDAPERLNKSVTKNKLSYKLYSDGDGSLIKAMGIAFKAPEKYSNMLLKHSDDKNSEVLPVPSLFVLDTNGTIVFEYVNPDYKTRMSPEDLIKTLKSLKK